MPIYQLVHSGVPLTFAKRDRLAKGITEIHHSETDAPEPFVRVVFEPLPLGTVYTAGEISPSVLLSCGIRAGRSDAARRRIIRRCYDLVSEVTKVPPDQIVVVVEEAPSAWIMEAGLFMPEPTREAEAAWIKQLQDTYPGKYDGWGRGGKRPVSARPDGGHAHTLLELAQEMVDQARREGVAAAEILGPSATMVTRELASTAEAGGAGRRAHGGDADGAGTHATGGSAGRTGTAAGVARWVGSLDEQAGGDRRFGFGSRSRPDAAAASDRP